jgi:hypothetical protein
MGFFGSIFGLSKMNADPIQQEFARLFIEAAESGNSSKLTNFIIRQPWSASDTRSRIAHALSIVKIASIPATYVRAKEIGKDFHMASYRLG